MSQPPRAIDSAMKGTINRGEFVGILADYIRAENANVIKNLELKLSKNALDFDVSGNPSPVVEFDDVNHFQKDQLTIQNLGKKKIYYEIEFVPLNKFELKINPQFGEIQKKGKVDIDFTVRVFCTTKVYQMLKVCLYSRNPRDKKNRFFGSTTALKLEKSPSSLKSEDDLGTLYICFKIESELSSSIDFDEIIMGPKIAKGGFGTVYKATWRNATIALKMMNNNTDELVEEERQAVIREIKLMNRLNHSNIVTYMGSTQIKGQPLCILMEYIAGGSLTDLLEAGNLSEKFRVKLALDIATGMSFLHSNNIYHRDLKPDNMLVVSSDPNTAVNLKITDFGTSRAAKKNMANNSEYLSFNQAQEEQQMTAEAKKQERTFTKGVGTLIYQAPEILMGKSDYAIDKTDIFSFGVLLWQVFTGREPFLDEPYKDWGRFEITDFVTSGKRLEIPSSIHRTIRYLIERSWHPTPNARPTFSEIAAQLQTLHSSMKEEPALVQASNLMPIPSVQDLDNIGWSGKISRQESEQKLKGSETGTFIVRWSNHTSSYVLSYNSGGDRFQHIAYIRPEKDNSITVDKQDGSVSHYENLNAYIEAMKKSGIIKNPFKDPVKEDLYERSPSYKS